MTDLWHACARAQPGKVQAHSASFWREADMLASLNHPNVLRFYGAVVASSDDPAVVGIMTEYMRGGSLSHFLTCARAALVPERGLVPMSAAKRMSAPCMPGIEACLPPVCTSWSCTLAALCSLRQIHMRESIEHKLVFSCASHTKGLV